VLRNTLLKIQERDEQILDVVSEDRLIAAEWDEQADEQAHASVKSFQQFMEQHRDELTALTIFYSRPHNLRLTEKDLRQLEAAIKAPPLGLTTDKLWQAYQRIDPKRVLGNDGSRENSENDGNSGNSGNSRNNKNLKRRLTDLVSLVRYTLERDNNEAAVLEPYSDIVARNFAIWLNEQERARGKPFTAEQRKWLILIRDHVAAALTIEQEDFESSPFVQHGGLGKAYQLFGDKLKDILQDLNERLAA
jgi:type I restriction enzyme R subunit